MLEPARGERSRLPRLASRARSRHPQSGHVSARPGRGKPQVAAPGEKHLPARPALGPALPLGPASSRAADVPTPAAPRGACLRGKGALGAADPRRAAPGRDGMECPVASSLEGHPVLLAQGFQAPKPVMPPRAWLSLAILGPEALLPPSLLGPRCLSLRAWVCPGWGRGRPLGRARSLICVW